MPHTARPGLRELVGRKVRTIRLCLVRMRSSKTKVDRREAYAAAMTWLDDLETNIAPELTGESLVEELCLEAVLVNPLARAGIATVADLTGQTRQSLARISGVGPSRIETIEWALNLEGLGLTDWRPRCVEPSRRCRPDATVPMERLSAEDVAELGLAEQGDEAAGDDGLKSWTPPAGPLAGFLVSRQDRLGVAAA